MCVLHMCDSRSRTARNLALDCCFLVLFAALRARGRPEIDFDYLFKAKKVTLREDSANRKSPGRQKGSVHRLISLRKLMFLCVFNGNRKSAKHTYLLSYFDTFGGSESPEIENPPKRLPFKAKTHAFWEVFAKSLETHHTKLQKTPVITVPFTPPEETRNACVFDPSNAFWPFREFLESAFSKWPHSIRGVAKNGGPRKPGKCENGR